MFSDEMWLFIYAYDNELWCNKQYDDITITCSLF